MEKQQVVIVPGGETFKTYQEYIEDLKNTKIDLEKYRRKDWKSQLQEDLGEKYEVFLLKMPNPNNAKYKEWKLFFDKVTSLLKENPVLVGHSLGGVFLVRYISEDNLNLKVLASMLIGAPYSEKEMQEYSENFIAPDNLERFRAQNKNIFIYHSKDDPVVPYINFKKYQEAFPQAITRSFEDKDHFKQDKFPELVRDIKSL